MAVSVTQMPAVTSPQTIHVMPSVLRRAVGECACGRERWRAHGLALGRLVVLDFDTRDGPELVLGMTPEQLAVVTIDVEASEGGTCTRAMRPPRSGRHGQGSAFARVARWSSRRRACILRGTPTRSSEPAGVLWRSMRSLPRCAPPSGRQRTRGWFRRSRDLVASPEATRSMAAASTTVRVIRRESRGLRRRALPVGRRVERGSSRRGARRASWDRARERGLEYARLTVARAFAARGHRAQRLRP